MIRYIYNSWPFLFGLALGLIFTVFNITGFGFSYFPGDLGDGRFNMYLLEHAHKFFTGQVGDFWSAPFMYPEANVISYSDNLLGAAPLYSLFRWMSFSRETSFQSWFVLMAVLNYACSYLFLKRLFRNQYAAALGAMVFAFSMSLQTQMPHAQTFPRFPIPLALWMASLFLENLQPKYFFAALLFASYQLYCGIYLGFMLMIPLMIIFLIIFIVKWELLKERLKNLKWVSFITTSIILNVLLLLPLLIPYIKRAQETGLKNYHEIFGTLPSVSSYFSCPKGTLFWDFISDFGKGNPAWWDHQLYLGGMVSISIVLFLSLAIYKGICKTKVSFFQLDINVKVLLISGLITFLLFLRIQQFSLYSLIFYLPGYGSLRSLTRIINIELIFFAIIITFFTQLLLKKKNLSSALVFVFLAGVFMGDNFNFAEPLCRTEKSMAQNRVNDVMLKMRSFPPKSIVSYEPAKIELDPLVYQIDAMLATQSLNLTAVNGYSATAPVGFDVYWAGLNEKTRLHWFEVKKCKPDTVYVVH